MNRKQKDALQLQRIKTVNHLMDYIEHLPTPEHYAKLNLEAATKAAADAFLNLQIALAGTK